MHFCLVCKTILEIIGFLHFLYLGYGILCSGGRTIFLTGERQPHSAMWYGIGLEKTYYFVGQIVPHNIFSLYLQQIRNRHRVVALNPFWKRCY